ncbi:MAG: hypothetical protein PHI97_24940 [Desulfobulbus sp.]|nr:hypothetical protein [Desulfobulbus sp.]
MKTNLDWMNELKKVLRFDACNNTLIQILVTFIFPIIEAILASVLASAIFGKTSVFMPSICLGAIVIAHLVLGVTLVLRSQVLAPQYLAEAIETRTALEHSAKELERRNEAYRMVREAFDALNTETCYLDPWCDEDFAKSLSPIIRKITDNCVTVLGVSGTKYTFEVYFQTNYVRCLKLTDSNSLNQSFQIKYFFSPQIPVEYAKGLPESSLLLPIFHQKQAKDRTINDDPTVFYGADSKRRPEVYFSRYAAHPIFEACSTQPIGVLVLTSEQDKPFADDVIDIMGFICSLLSRFVFSYNNCVAWRIAELEKNALTNANITQP